MTHTPGVSVRPLHPSDESRWRELFRGYRDFYRLEESEEVVSRVWQWLLDPTHECQALVAESVEGIVAIGHYRRFSRPSSGTVGIWLDDLFTAPQARGIGAARAVIHRLTEIAGTDGGSVVRWITADDNHQAQALYDQVATRTHWVTYDAAPTMAEPEVTPRSSFHCGPYPLT
jgi:GNAT superfamily N-acetyltransferase